MTNSVFNLIQTLDTWGTNRVKFAMCFPLIVLLLSLVVPVTSIFDYLRRKLTRDPDASTSLDTTQAAALTVVLTVWAGIIAWMIGCCGLSVPVFLPLFFVALSFTIGLVAYKPLIKD